MALGELFVPLFAVRNGGHNTVPYIEVGISQVRVIQVQRWFSCQLDSMELQWIRRCPGHTVGIRGGEAEPACKLVARLPGDAVAVSLVVLLVGIGQRESTLPGKDRLPAQAGSRIRT